MKKYLVTAAFAALALAGTRPAFAADYILFDPTGTGTSFTQIAGLDWQPGNGIAVDANLASPLNTDFTVFYQAQLAVTGGPVNDLQLPYTGTTQYFTVVAGFGETILGVPNAGNFNTITFGFDSSQTVNFFAIYASSTPASNLQGTSFVDGTPILVGHIIADGYSSTFQTTSANGGLLDQTADGNQYLNQTTIRGSGTSTINVAVDSYNTNYFQGLSGAIITTVVNSGTGTAVPYDDVDPSACFFASTMGGSVTLPTCNGTGVPGHGIYGGTAPLVGVGSIDGVNDGVFTQVNGSATANNTMLKIDANSSFLTVASPVPEPATLGLLGFGLLGAVAAGRRLRRKQ